MFNIKTIPVFLSVCIFSTFAESKTTVHLSQNEIAYGSGVSLIFQSDEELKELPDLSELEKKVKITGKSQSNKVQIINGNVSKSYETAFQIFPLTEGEIQIGPFNIEGEKTPSLTLKVTKNSQSTKTLPTDADTPQIIFKTSFINPTIYEGQLGIYQASVYDDSALQDAELNMPRVAGFNISTVDADKITQEYKEQKPIRVFKRFFTFSPEKTGTYTIPPASLSGYVADKRTQRPNEFMGDFFNLPLDFAFNRIKMQPVYFQSNETTLTVLKKPDNWQGWWLPSSDVSLSEEYKIPNVIKIGDVIERTITLSAKDVESAKLPPIYHPETEDLTNFSNPEDRFSIFENNAVISKEVQTFILSPQKEGKIIIPSVEIKYFNTLTKQTEKAVLPSKEISVIKNTALSRTTTNPTDNLQNTENTEKPKPIEIKNENNTNTHQIFLILSLGFIIIFSLVGFFIYKKKKKKPTLIEKTKKTHKQNKRKKPLPDLYPF